MKKTLTFLLFLSALMLQAQTARKFTINLTDDGKANVEAFLPASPSGRAIVGVPGGGYSVLSNGHEGRDWHEWLSCVISSFITKPQPVFLMCCNMIQLHDEYCTGNGMVSSLSMAKLLKKLKLNRLLLYFLFYLSPYIDDVGVLLVGYRDYTKSSLAGHEEFYSLDVYIP